MAGRDEAMEESDLGRALLIAIRSSMTEHGGECVAHHHRIFANRETWANVPAGKSRVLIYSWIDVDESGDEREDT